MIGEEVWNLAMRKLGKFKALKDYRDGLVGNLLKNKCLKAIFNMLPTPQNLSQWVGKYPTCPICVRKANLKYIQYQSKV